MLTTPRLLRILQYALHILSAVMLLACAGMWFKFTFLEERMGESLIWAVITMIAFRGATSIWQAGIR